MHHQFILWKRIRKHRRNSYPLPSRDYKIIFPSSAAVATVLPHSSWSLDGYYTPSLFSCFLPYNPTPNAPTDKASTQT